MLPELPLRGLHMSQSAITAKLMEMVKAGCGWEDVCVVLTKLDIPHDPIFIKRFVLGRKP